MFGHSSIIHFSREHPISRRRKRTTTRPYAHGPVDNPNTPTTATADAEAAAAFLCLARPPATKSRCSAARRRSPRPVGLMNIDETRSVSLRQKLYDGPRRAFSGPPRRIETAAQRDVLSSRFSISF